MGAGTAAATLFGVLDMHPGMIPSSLYPVFSLMIHNSASSPLTFRIMLRVVLVFPPVVIIYQTWACRLFATRMQQEDTAHGEAC